MASERQSESRPRPNSALAQALDSLHELQAENERLRARINALEGQADEVAEAAPSVPWNPTEPRFLATFSTQEKLAIYQDLFRGREDVFATRWESLDGRSGYAPVLRREAPRGRRIKHDPSDYVPLTSNIIRDHLTGVRTIGIYPLLADESCWLLAFDFDFDKEHWQKDVLAVLDACDALGIAPALERSRSGQGAHLWVFFTSPVQASLARNLGSAILTTALDHRQQIGLDSYDRLFPSQDTLPTGGFGNLIALPLQGMARRAGNTVFLDRDLEAHPDQWRYLASIKKLDPIEVDSIVRDARREARLIALGDGWFEDDSAEQAHPWTLPPSRHVPEPPISAPLPASVDVVFANRVFIKKGEMPSLLVGRLRRLAAFQNPEFYRSQAMRLSTFRKPRFIDCSEDFPDHLALPRGCLPAVRRLLAASGVSIALLDERQDGQPIQVAFQGDLMDKQLEAAQSLIKHEIGVLSAPTAFGKTVVGSWLIARRSVNTLVLVHRQVLLDQWRAQLASFLDLSAESIGQIGGGKRRPTGIVDVALIQSLVRKAEVNDIVANYGQVIVDECHHVPAVSFERVLAEVRARFVVGLTATTVRKDGHQPIIAMQCGPVRLKVDAKEQADARPFEHEVLVRTTEFQLMAAPTNPGIQDIYSQLAADHARTSMIISDVLKAVQAGRSPLVLTERVEHLEQMARLLDGLVAHVVVFRGGVGVKQRRQLADELHSIPDAEPRVLLATGRYIGEGFDDARLDTLFLTLPVSWRGTIQQYAGRLHRLHEGKQLVQIFDYADLNVSMLGAMLRKRLTGYREIGYTARLGSSSPVSEAVSAGPSWRQRGTLFDTLAADGSGTSAVLTVDVHE